jgi:hypothetical protein
MQENHLFEYAVIRLVPRVEREEFLNVGVILFCKKEKFLQSLYRLDESRLKCLRQDIEISEIEAHLKTVELVCQGAPGAGPIAKLPIAERFRWLTATRSTVVQTSKVHPGFSKNMEATLLMLFNQMVL